MTTYQKLLSVQTKLKAPKSQYNSFGKYSYRNCEDILEAVKPICAEVKATVYLSDDIVMIGDRYYVKATATFVDVESGEGIVVNAFAREEETKKGMDGSQVTGASSSYARKYALNGLFDIDDTKDSDTTNTHGKDEPNVNPAPTKQKEKTPREMLIAKLKEKGINAGEYAKEKGLNPKTKDERYLELLAELG